MTLVRAHNQDTLPLRLNIFLMDELKLFGKSEDQIDLLVQTVQLLSKDIRLKFGLKKCSVLSIDRGMKLSLE